MKALVQNIEDLSQRVGSRCEAHGSLRHAHNGRISQWIAATAAGQRASRFRAGLPVCVTDPSYLDAAIELCGRPDVIIATFGDLVRVPGTDTSLERERAAGANVRIVYSAKRRAGAGA